MKIGGQAIIEGVMFRSPLAVSIAVRKPDGTIHSQSWKEQTWNAFLGTKHIPIIRGCVSLLEMILLGTKTLNLSADIATGEKTKTKWWHPIVFIITLILSLGFGLLIFKFLPLGVTWSLKSVFSIDSQVLFALIEGLIKLCVFLLYIGAIGFFPDIKRVFEYHGAEHKVIRAYEAKATLTPTSVAKHSRFHPRCGTSFVVFVIALSIFCYSFIQINLPLVQLFGLRLLLLPVIAGVAFELLQGSAYLAEKTPLRFFAYPGFAVQALTTREPDKNQIAVAISSFKACMKESNER